jgi:predicted RNase H-like HicB family nuclease
VPIVVLGKIKKQEERPVPIYITTLETEGHGWIAFAPEARATAQGETQEEAKQNLIDLLLTYPDLLDEVRKARSRKVELLTV